MTAPPRYKPLHPLGTGGMGTVLACEDTERGGVVALKTLTDVDPLALSLFKNEFRALADLAHPNLVALYELGQHEDKPFFTMEVVDDAVDLLKFVRGTDHESGRTWLSAMGDLDPDATLPPLQHAPEPPPGDLPLPSPLPDGGEARLRDALGQLAEALATLHAHGKIHRDVKPSNVLVEPGGRVVLVDFGLVCSLDGVGGGLREVIAGSVPYMSPEQSVGADVGPAADWYAFGAVLYELLTGRPPFAGARAAVLAAKRGREVVPPQDVVDGVPEDLGALAVRLLRTDPAARPSGDETLAVFGRQAPRRASGPLVGRDALLAGLDVAAAGASTTSTAVHLRGPSGHGKSSLAEAWLARHPDALAVRSRCYERDHLPYKAIDPLVEGLVRHIATLPPSTLAALVPRHVRELRQVFPALERLAPFAEAEARTPPTEDPEEARRRLHVSLRDLFARVASRGHLVAFVDDVQWADRESLVALAELRRQPDAPMMLWVLAYRDEHVDDRLHALASHATCLELRALAEAPARALVARHLADASLHDAVLAEAQGVPFHLIELAVQADHTGVAPSLSDYIHARVLELPEVARTLLSLAALAGKPTRRDVLESALGESSTAPFAVLSAARLVQTDDERAWPIHDRIRESVRDSIETPAPLHSRLARALIRAEEAPEDIARHLAEANERKEAAHYTRLAAERAHEQLAFGLEAEMWRQLLDLQPETDDRAHVLSRLGRALHVTGSLLEAADAALASVEAGGPEIERARAALRLSHGGDPRGPSAVTDVLRRVGYRLPRTAFGRALRAVWTRLWTRIRRLPQRHGAANDLRLETLKDMGLWHLATDSLLSYAVLAEYVRDAFARGSTDHMLQAAAIEIALCGGEPLGGARSEKADQLAQRLLPAAGVEARALYFWLRTFALVQQGRWREAGANLDNARKAFEVVPTMATERRWLGMYECIFEGFEHGPAALVRLESERVASALEMNDVAFVINARFANPISTWLVLDDPDGGDRDAALYESRWPGRDDTQAFYISKARTASAAYRDGWATLEPAMADAAEVVRRSRADAHQGNRGMWGYAQGLYRVARDTATPAHVTRATDGMGTLGRALGTHVEGLSQLRQGQRAEAAATLAHTAQRFRDEHVHTFAVITDWALGHATGDEHLQRTAETWAAEEGVVAPLRWLAYHNADLGRFWTP